MNSQAEAPGPLEETLSHEAKEKACAELSASFTGEFETPQSSHTPRVVCTYGDCAGPLPLYRAMADKFSQRSSPCGGGGDAFNVARVRTFGSLTSDIRMERAKE